MARPRPTCELLRGLLDGTAKIDGLDVDQELRWAFLEPLAAHGAADEDGVAAELARDDTASGKRHQVRCLAARPSAAVKAQAWAPVVESDALSNALVEATIAGSPSRAQRELLAPYAERYFDGDRAGLDRSARSRSAWTWSAGCSRPAGLARRRSTPPTPGWTAHADAAPALRRLVLECRDDLARALRAQAWDEAAGAASRLPLTSGYG